MPLSDVVYHILRTWMARAGDAYLSSLINTCLYGAGVVVCALRVKSLRQATGPVALQVFWLGVLALLLAFGLNKQLDFQVLLAEIARPIAQTGGWYETRRVAQVWFAIALAAVAGGFIAMMAYLIRRHWRSHALALCGIGILCLYGIVEATPQSLLPVKLYSFERWGFRLSDLFEMTGIALILINALSGRKNIVR